LIDNIEEIRRSLNEAFEMIMSLQDDNEELTKYIENLEERLTQLEKRFLGMRQRIDDIQEAHHLW